MLFEPWEPPPRPDAEVFRDGLREFAEFGQPTVIERAACLGLDVFVNEFWTSKQRAAARLHEISYRACFKPQLPRFFIERLTKPGDCVYDPFMGRGTTLLEAALLGRVPAGNDVNPLSAQLIAPRLSPPALDDVTARLAAIPWTRDLDEFEPENDVHRDDLLVFFHPETLAELLSLRIYLRQREQSHQLDGVDAWIRMVAINRLTGHSSGFFSVYTMPPNQAVSPASQRKINSRRDQKPPRRDVPQLIAAKSKSLLGDLTPDQRGQLQELARASQLSTAPADRARSIKTGSVALAVTSPPFLTVVQYAADNWLRCWFAGIRPDDVAIAMHGKIDAWTEMVRKVFVDLRRIVRPGGYVAFEVGEVKQGKVRLEEHVIPAARAAGMTPELVMIHAQEFTKTANCWGIDNNRLGTNTNRIVLIRR